MTLDVSNYDAPTFNAACFKAHGVTGIIVGCQDEPLARAMIEEAQRAQLPVLATYAFLYFGLSVAQQVITAYSVAADYQIPYVALDVESSGQYEARGETPYSRAEQLRQSLRIIEGGSNGLRPIIYTYEPYWRNQMGNTTEFAHYPLWLAHYLDYNATPFERRHAGFGGWETVAIHQWTSTLEVCGRKRDANHCWLHEEEEMSQEDRDRLARLERLVAANGYGRLMEDPPNSGKYRWEFTGEEAMQMADADGSTLFGGLGLTQAAFYRHMHNVAAQRTTAPLAPEEETNV